MRRALSPALLALAACGGPADVAPPPGSVIEVVGVDPYADPAYPSVLGTIRATLDGQAVEWVTADYSVGAVDPSARIGTSGTPPRLVVQGIREAVRRSPPDRDLGNLVIEGTMAAPPAPGPVAAPRIEIVPGNRVEGLPRLTSRGRPVEVVIETLDAGDGSARYGSATGRLRATLCRAADAEAVPDASDCVALEGTFDTRLYVGGG